MVVTVTVTVTVAVTVTAVTVVTVVTVAVTVVVTVAVTVVVMVTVVVTVTAVTVAVAVASRLSGEPAGFLQRHGPSGLRCRFHSDLGPCHFLVSGHRPHRVRAGRACGGLTPGRCSHGRSLPKAPGCPSAARCSEASAPRPPCPQAGRWLQPVLPQQVSRPPRVACICCDVGLLPINPTYPKARG